MTGKNEKREYLGVATESVYGTTPAMVFPGVEIYAEDITWKEETKVIPRNAASPRRPGFGNVKGAKDVNLSFKTEIYYLNTATGSQTTHNDPVYDACFEDITGTTTRTRSVADYSFNSLSADLHEENTSGGAGTKHTFQGLRGNIAFDMPLNDRVMSTVTLKGRAVAHADYSGGSVPALVYQDSNSDYRLPVVNKNATISFATDEATPDTLASPFFSGSVDLGLSPEAVESSSSSTGIEEITLNAQEAGKAKISMSQEEVATFNPWDYIGGENMEISITWTEPGGSDTVAFKFWAQITAVANTVVGKRKAWDIELDLVYPETGSSHNAGQTPASVFSIEWN